MRFPFQYKPDRSGNPFSPRIFLPMFDAIHALNCPSFPVVVKNSTAYNCFTTVQTGEGFQSKTCLESGRRDCIYHRLSLSNCQVDQMRSQKQMTCERAFNEFGEA